MSPRLRNTLINLGGVLLAALLLYLALRGVDLADIVSALVAADYRWILPVVVVLLGSHGLRAIRWTALMEALEAPEPDSDPHRHRTAIAFSSIMIGYMINYAAPRLGEVARSANYARLTRSSMAGVLGTVVAERVLDVLALLLGLVVVAFLLAGRLRDVALILFEGQDLTGLLLLALAAVLAITVGSILLYFFGRLLRASEGARYAGLVRRVRPIVYSFRDGVMAAVRAPRRWLIAGTTLAMWLLYMVAAYIPFAMLGLVEPYGIDMSTAWVMMILGSLGVVVPSPGGIGSYHYITIQGLAILYAVSATDAASYAFLTHAAQFVLYLAVGLICLVTQTLLTRHRPEKASI